MAFLDRLFPRELREDKLEEFINLKKGNLSVKEHALKFDLSSKYAPSLVTNPADLMNSFMTRVSDLVEEECRMEMIVDDMDISRLKVFDQQIEESKQRKERAKENKRSRLVGDKPFHSKSKGQDRPRTKPRYSNRNSSNTSKVDKEKGNECSKSTFPKSGKSHYGIA